MITKSQSRQSEQFERHTQILHDYENKLSNQKGQQSYCLQQIPNSYNYQKIKYQDNSQNIGKHQIIFQQQKNHELQDHTESVKSQNKVSGMIPKVIQQMSNPQVISFKNAFSKLKNKKANQKLEQQDQNYIISQKIPCNSINEVQNVESQKEHENDSNEHSLIRQQQAQAVSHNLVVQSTQLHNFNSSGSLPSNDQLPRDDNLKREIQQKIIQQNHSTKKQLSTSKKQQELKSFTDDIEENHNDQYNQIIYQVNSHPIQTNVDENQHIQFCIQQEQTKVQKIERYCRQNIQYQQGQDHQEVLYQPLDSHQQNIRQITNFDVNKHKSQNQQFIEETNKDNIRLQAGFPADYENHVQKIDIHEINTDMFPEKQDHAYVNDQHEQYNLLDEIEQKADNQIQNRKSHLNINNEQFNSICHQQLTNKYIVAQTCQNKYILTQQNQDKKSYLVDNIQLDKLEMQQINKEEENEEFEKIEVPLQQNVQFKAGDLIYSGEMNIANTEHLMKNILEDYSHLLQRSHQN